LTTTSTSAGHTDRPGERVGAHRVSPSARGDDEGAQTRLCGALEQLGAPLEATGLRPFVEPHVCVADLQLADV